MLRDGSRVAVCVAPTDEELAEQIQATTQDELPNVAPL
jgi:hypothetical protein